MDNQKIGRVDPVKLAHYDSSSKILSPRDVFDSLFFYARSGGIIATGAWYPEEKKVKYLSPISVGRPRQMDFFLDNFLGNRTTYFCPQPLTTSALPEKYGKDPKQYLAHATSHLKPWYFAVKTKNVKEIAAIVVDLDVGHSKGDITGIEAIMVALSRAEYENKFPWPSFAALSGRGAYLIWCLIDDSGEHLPLSNEENVQIWDICGQWLIKELRDLKADANAKRLVNWYKMPGTTDFRTGNIVKFMSFGVGALNIPRYTLHEFRDALGLPTSSDTIIEVNAESVSVDSGQYESDYWKQACPQQKKRPKRRVQHGQGSQPHQKRYLELEKLFTARGEIPDGNRHISLQHYFWNYRSYLYMNAVGDEKERRKMAHYEACTAIRKINKKLCNPPCTKQELEKIFKANLSWGKNIYRNSRIALDLNVTDQEARDFGLQHIVPEAYATLQKQEKNRVQNARRQTREKIAAEVDAELLECKGEGLAEIGKKFSQSRQYVYSRRKRLIKLGRLKLQESTEKDQTDLF